MRPDRRQPFGMIFQELPRACSAAGTAGLREPSGGPASRFSLSAQRIAQCTDWARIEYEVKTRKLLYHDNLRLIRAESLDRKELFG
jgi:hypothetical protein